MTGHPYRNSLAASEAAFDPFAFPIRELRDDSQLYPGQSEVFTAPALDGGRSRWQLAMIPAEQSGFSAKIGTTAQTILPWGVTPSAGQVAVDFARGVVELPAASAEADEFVVEYTGRGTPITAYLGNTVQLGVASRATALAPIVDVTLDDDGDPFDFDGIASGSVLVITATAASEDFGLPDNAPAGYRFRAINGSTNDIKFLATDLRTLAAADTLDAQNAQAEFLHAGAGVWHGWGDLA